MKIDLLFPIFEDATDFFKKFFATKFCKKDDELTYFFYIKKGTNLDFIKTLPKGQKYVIRETTDNFNLNDAFLDYLSQDTSCDALLLGDTKVGNLGKLFSKCIEKANDGAHLVHIRYAKGKFRRFFSTLKEKFLNLFISIFTGKKDKFNIPTLGLIDDKILSILKTLPRKACFLKNTNMFYGYEGRTIFIARSTPYHKENFWRKTPCLKMSFGCLGLNLLSIAGIVLGTVFSKIILLVCSLFLCLASLAGVVLFGVKHLIDIRSKGLNATFSNKKAKKSKSVLQ